MGIDVGELIWVKCEVKPGPFPDERVVLVDTLDGPWVGFVDVHSLADPAKSGKTSVRGVVVEVKRDTLLVRLPGHSTAGRMIRRIDDGLVSRGALQA
jgi:hypothetical protein